jgi:hypothetical protein
VAKTWLTALLQFRHQARPGLPPIPLRLGLDSNHTDPNRFSLSLRKLRARFLRELLRFKGRDKGVISFNGEDLRMPTPEKLLARQHPPCGLPRSAFSHRRRDIGRVSEKLHPTDSRTQDQEKMRFLRCAPNSTRRLSPPVATGRLLRRVKTHQIF